SFVAGIARVADFFRGDPATLCGAILSGMDAAGGSTSAGGVASACGTSAGPGDFTARSVAPAAAAGGVGMRADPSVACGGTAGRVADESAADGAVRPFASFSELSWIASHAVPMTATLNTTKAVHTAHAPGLFGIHARNVER